MFFILVFVIFPFELALTLKIIPKAKHVIQIEDPPELINGNVCPVVGAKPVATAIFINAWNEWAEGNHLEPCQKWGTEYLKVTKEAFEK